MKTINNVDVGDIVTDGHGTYAEVKTDERDREYYANIDSVDDNAEVIEVSDLWEDHLD